MKAKKILITGGSGFVGCNLVESLSQDYTVLAPSSKELDLLDYAGVETYLAKNSVDTVLHCAGYVISRNFKRDTSKILEANLRMYHNLARLSDQYRLMISFGSGAEYDKRAYIPRMSEDYFDASVPEDPYGFSKYCIAKDIRSKENIVNLRLFGCFGPYEDWEVRFISNAICKAMHGMNIRMHQNIAFDYLYVRDLARIVVQFIEAEKINHSEYNVCTGHVVEIKAVAECVRTISGKKLKIFAAKKGLGVEYSGDNTRLMEEFPQTQFTPLERSVKELYTWYTERKDSISKEKLKLNK